MGAGLSKLNELKRSINNTVAQLKGEEPETGYLGSPPVKFPKTELPSGCKNLDLRANQGKIPEVLKVMIYECVDELKKDGSYRFSGVEITWRDKMTGQTQRIEHMSGEKDGCRKIEVGSLDYIKKVILSTKEHEGVKYVSFCGIQSHLAEPAGAGDLKVPVKVCESTNKEFTEGALGLRLVVHKKLKVIVDVIPVFARVADKKTKVDEERRKFHSFLTSYKDVQALYGTKIYSYKSPENKYEDFSTFITNGKMREEFLGGLPLRFLSPEESQRFFALRDKLNLQPLIDLLINKGSIHHLKLDPAMEDKVVNFVVEILLHELVNNEGKDFENNIRFCMKMLCIVYNDDEKIWKRIKGKVEEQYKTMGGSLFDKAMEACTKDPNLKEVQKIEDFTDAEVKEKYQKACPQCPDDGKEDDVEKIAKKYMLDAAQYLQEFHAAFKSMFKAKKTNYGIGLFNTKDTEYHGAATVKGLDRIKAKAQEYQDEEKLSASDAIARTMDYLRGTIECQNLHEVIMAYNKLKNMKGDFKVVRVKNGFQDMTEKSYKKILLNIMIYNTQIAEVQITIAAFKEGNTINHFLYEVLREHSLYDMVSKNLNLGTAFKEWIEPIAPDSMHEIWPKNQNIHLKGFCLVGSDGFWGNIQPDPKNRKYCTMLIKPGNDYQLSGLFAWPGQNYKLIDAQSKVKFPVNLEKISQNVSEAVGKVNDKAGKALADAISFGKKMKDTATKVSNTLGVSDKEEADDHPKIEWRMTPYGGGGPYGGVRREVGIFTGKFIDDQIIEGTFIFKPCDDFGREIQNLPLGHTCTKGSFRFWVDDSELPGLNPTLLAFRDIMKNSKVIRRKFIPTKVMEWTGTLGGSGKKDADEPISLKMKVGNPNNFPYSSSITGKGRLGKARLSKAAGYHMNYDNVTLTLCLPPGAGGCFSFAGPRNIPCIGRFIEDLKIIGTYDDRGHLGRFNIECVDKNAVKQFGPKGENDDGRWDLLIIYNDGEKQYNQLVMKINPDHTVAGSGYNFSGNFHIEGKEDKKGIYFTRTQKNADGTAETLTFDGMFITGGVYEGQFRSENDWGKFKLSVC